MDVQMKLVELILDLQIENKNMDFMAKANEESNIVDKKRGSGSRKPHLKGRDKKNKEWRKPYDRGANHDRLYDHGRRSECRVPFFYDDDITMSDISAIVDAEYAEARKIAIEAKKRAEENVAKCRARVMWALEELQKAEEDLEAIE